MRFRITIVHMEEQYVLNIMTVCVCVCVCVFLTLVILHANRILSTPHCIAKGGLSGSTRVFLLSHKRLNFRERTLLDIKSVF
jgi:hypothetical protein